LLLVAVSVGAILAVTAAVPGDAMACSCPPTPTPAPPPGYDYDRAAAVFSGSVIAVRDSDRPLPDRYEKRIDVTVDIVWKGPVRGRHTLYNADQWAAAACGYPFKVGKKYIVYAQTLADDSLTTNVCYGTSAYDPELAAELGAGVRPRPPLYLPYGASYAYPL
jgi:hypothetical protein